METRTLCTWKSHVLALLCEANNVMRPVPSLPHTRQHTSRFQTRARSQVKVPFILGRMPLIKDMTIEQRSKEEYVRATLCHRTSSGSRTQTSLDPHLIAPGSTTTSAAAIVVEIVNVVESTTFTLPPLSGVTGTCDSGYVNG